MRGICTHSICCAQSHSNTRRPPLSSKRACSAPNLSSEWVAGSGFVFNGLDAHQSSLACYLGEADRKSTRLNSSHSQISYAAFCLKKKNHVADGEHRDLFAEPDLAAARGARRFASVGSAVDVWLNRRYLRHPISARTPFALDGTNT